MRIKIPVAQSAETKVVEGEIRMQSQQAVASRKCSVDARPKDAWQISADSDSICLALILEEKGLFREYANVFVKLPTRYADIRVLH